MIANETKTMALSKENHQSTQPIEMKFFFVIRSILDLPLFYDLSAYGEWSARARTHWVTCKLS